MSSASKDEATVWFHFPKVENSGCEGILVVNRNNTTKAKHILLVDGSIEQVAYVRQLLVRQRRSPARPPLSVKIVLSHFHQDHTKRVALLLALPQSGRQIQRVYHPSTPNVSWPDETRVAMARLGPLLVKRYASKRAPYCVPVGVGDAQVAWNHDGIFVQVTGAAPPNWMPSSKHKQENSRSLMVFGAPLEAMTLPPVGRSSSFLLPGDAEPPTWKWFQEHLESHNNLLKAMPVAVLKLAHHGAGDTNSRDVIDKIFGVNRACRPHQLAVRIRNAVRDPRGRPDVESLLAALRVNLWDTRDDGPLWVRLNRSGGLVRAKTSTAPHLGLPAGLRSKRL